MTNEELLQKIEELGKGNPIFDAGYLCGYQKAVKEITEYIRSGGQKHNGTEK